MEDAHMEKHVDICIEGGKTRLKILWKQYQWRIVLRAAQSFVWLVTNYELAARLYAYVL